MEFEEFLDKHKNDYTYAQKSTLDGLLSDMQTENEAKTAKESQQRLNNTDFDILDIEHDLEFGRKDLNQGQTIDYSDLSEEQLKVDEETMDEHYQKFFQNYMSSGNFVSIFLRVFKLTILSSVQIQPKTFASESRKKTWREKTSCKTLRMVK